MKFSCIIFLFLLATACQDEPIKQVAELKQSIENKWGPQKTDWGKAIWGYRFSLVGDFDGDQQIDTLVEHFVDVDLDQETNKFFENLELMDYQWLEKKRNTQSFMLCRGAQLDTLIGLAVLGVEYAEIIGDIDGDGGDEIGLVNYHADISSVNTYTIYSYKKGWQKMYSFEIRDWELPDLPEYNAIYGFWGTFECQAIQDTLLNKKMEKALKEYQRVQLIAPNIIEYESFGVGDCGDQYRLAAQLNGTSWICASNDNYASNVQKIWVAYDWEPTEDLKGRLIEICDPASSFKQRLWFKKKKEKKNLTL